MGIGTEVSLNESRKTRRVLEASRKIELNESECEG